MKQAKNSLNGAAITLCMTPEELERKLNSDNTIISLQQQLDEAKASIVALRERNEMLQQNLAHFLNKKNV